MDLQKQVILLTKALEREKSARQQLEDKLELQHKKKFEVNKELLKSYENARIREVQLQFLSFLSNNNIDDKSFTEMLQYFAQNIALLLENAPAYIIKRKNEKIIQTWLKPENQNEWENGNFKEIIIDFELTPNCWKRVISKTPTLYKLLGNEYLISIHFPHSENNDVIIVIGGKHFCYSEDLKQTLDIAAKQFSTILDKRLTDVELSFNYQKLRRTMKVLKSTQNKLIHSEKMASLGTLAAGVAHEINNPLSYLTSNLETLDEYIQVIVESNAFKSKDTLDSNTSLKNVLSDLPDLQSSCLDASKRIAEIVNSLRSFSRKENKDKTLINITEPINAALDILQSELKHKYEITKSFTSKTCEVNANYGQLQQVFVNLFINAAHSMPDGGNITITTQSDEDSLVVMVEDEGCGIDKKTQSRLFEPFFTTKKVNEGTGLGLSVSYAILNNHGANISVESSINKGSIFKVNFPLPIDQL